jgi:hypothetical protein
MAEIINTLFLSFMREMRVTILCLIFHFLYNYAFCPFDFALCLCHFTLSIQWIIQSVTSILQCVIFTAIVYSCWWLSAILICNCHFAFMQLIFRINAMIFTCVRVLATTSSDLYLSFCNITLQFFNVERPFYSIPPLFCIMPYLYWICCVAQ